MATCKVKSFSMSFGNWNTSLPGIFSKTTTIRLPVKFKLVLDEGCTKADCIIGQYMRGRVERGGRVEDDFVDWRETAATGNPSGGMGMIGTAATVIGAGLERKRLSKTNLGLTMWHLLLIRFSGAECHGQASLNSVRMSWTKPARRSSRN